MLVHLRSSVLCLSGHMPIRFRSISRGAVKGIQILAEDRHERDS